MAKAVTTKVKLLSSADTGYDPVARKHVEFRETKIK